MKNFTERFASSIGRHFVTLSCVQHSLTPKGVRIHLFSGFVVDIMGEWFYVTAGHILRDVSSAINGGSTFDLWRLDDQTAGKRFNNIAVPYDFQIEHWCVLEDASVGLDYAAVHLGGLYRQQLEAGGVVPITKQAWGDYVTEHDHWVLYGIPSESISYDDTTQITAKVVMVPLVSAEPPPLTAQKAENQFYAKLADGSEEVVKDIDGMSGGPIFMLWKADDTWKYSVIGVQSSWYSSARVIAACPFSSFAEALEPVVEEALSELRRAK
ncbi:hypothetical protein [Pseudomonas sp. P42]|uniref:hypothetical protein n=1 Tax=Pseudomonas sp. P42 TaxID=1080160 RepID=UPI001B3412AA|nr:hypothetical protein [Pseudomonas sp. P42]MBP5949365.1 hypothetical protein [Pseudomonas sp. P42]